MIIGKHDQLFVCRSLLNIYTHELNLETQKLLCDNEDKAVYIPCRESHATWNKHYQKMPLYSTIYADFEAMSSAIIDQDNDRNKTVDICKEILVCNGYHVMNKLKPGY